MTDFNQLMSTMRALDTGADRSLTESECATNPISATTPNNQPTMNVSISAQGIDNIETMMKLFQKVNPDMPDSSHEFSVNMGSPCGDNTAGTQMIKAETEAYSNEPEERVMGMDQVVRNGNDMNRSKRTYPRVSPGDNPRQAVQTEASCGTDKSKGSKKGSKLQRKIKEQLQAKFEGRGFEQEEKNRRKLRDLNVHFMYPITELGEEVGIRIITDVPGDPGYSGGHPDLAAPPSGDEFNYKIVDPETGEDIDDSIKYLENIRDAVDESKVRSYYEELLRDQDDAWY